MEKNSKIFIAGDRGCLGNALKRSLYIQGYNNILTTTIDLRNNNDLSVWFRDFLPDYVFLVAARVGGYALNKKIPADILHDNLLIETNVIHQSYKHNVKKLLYVASASCYPKDAPNPIKETSLFCGKFEDNFIAYGLSKLAGVVLCQSYNEQYNTNFISILPNSFYGPFDTFKGDKAHVIAANIHKIIQAKKNNIFQIDCYSGDVLREFLFSYDLADCCLFLMNNYNENEPINVGIDKEYTIKEIIDTIVEIVNYKGKINWINNNNGNKRRKLDISKLNKLGWFPKYDIRSGLDITIKLYEE